MTSTGPGTSVTPEHVASSRVSGVVHRMVWSHGLAAIGMSVVWPLLLLQVWQETRSDTLLGLAGAARMLPYVLFSWATGRLADRFRRDRVVRWTLCARLILLGAMALCLASDWTLGALIAATGAVAASTPAFPALAAAMPRAAGNATPRATDLLVTAEVASFVVGPAIGGALLSSRTQPLIPVLALALTLIAALLFVGVRLPHFAEVTSAEPPRVWPMLRQSGQLRGAIGVVCALNGAVAAMALVLLPFAEEQWNDTGADYGLATAALGFGALGAPFLCRLGKSPQGRARAGLVIFAVCLAVVIPMPTVAFALVPLAMAGAADVYAEGAATSMMQDHAPDSLRGSVMGLADTAMIGTALIASLVTPLLATMLGPQAVILVAVAAIGLSCRWTSVPHQSGGQSGVTTEARLVSPEAA